MTLRELANWLLDLQLWQALLLLVPTAFAWGFGRAAARTLIRREIDRLDQERRQA